MNKYIYALVESYTDSTEQLNTLIKNTEALRRAEEKSQEARIEFINKVLGKQTFNKYANKGTFAPVPLSAIKLIKKDFLDLNPSKDLIKTDKMLERITVKYYRNDFTFIDNGYGEYGLKTDIVFKTIDEIIDFFYEILKAYKKVYHTEEIDWNPIVKKFRKYL